MSTVHISVVFPIACSADAAWRAAHTPAIADQLYRPLLQMSPRQGSLPATWKSGDSADVTLRALGIVPVGAQRISITDVNSTASPVGARTMRDAGRPLSGPLALLAGWRHEITTWPTVDHAAVWHDELTITGRAAPICALVLRPMWWWRRAKLRRMARSWQP